MRGQLVDKLGAREITMPRLYDWLVTALNRHNVTVTTALTHSAFHLLDRQRLKHWQSKLYSEIASVSESLLPTDAPDPQRASERAPASAAK